jgi:hypothetical protein
MNVMCVMFSLRMPCWHKRQYYHDCPCRYHCLSSSTRNIAADLPDQLDPSRVLEKMLQQFSIGIDIYTKLHCRLCMKLSQLPDTGLPVSAYKLRRQSIAESEV